MNKIELQNHCITSLKLLGARGTNIVIRQMDAATLGLTLYNKGARPTVVINEILMTESTTVINTIIAHEYAHVVAGESAGHNNKWAAIANKFSKILGGTYITSNVINGLNLSPSFWLTNYNYVYVCNKCGKFLGFNQERYKNIGNDITHKNCGGSWKKVK